jgi:DNA polymerase-4
VTRQQTLPRPGDTVEAIWPVARDLFRKADRRGVPIRLVGVTMSGFETETHPQLGMFEARGPAADRVVAGAVDRLRDRYGRDSVRRAALLADADRGRARSERGDTDTHDAGRRDG